jgi:hypothetical protein
MMKPHGLNIRVTATLLNQLERQARGLGVTMTTIIETVLMRHLDPREIALLDSRVIRWLDRMEMRQTAVGRDVATGPETFQHHVSCWHTPTKPISARERDAAHAAGKQRFDNFIEQVARKYGNAGVGLIDRPCRGWRAGLKSVHEGRSGLLCVSVGFDARNMSSPPGLVSGYRKINRKRFCFVGSRIPAGSWFPSKNRLFRVWCRRSILPCVRGW